MQLNLENEKIKVTLSTYAGQIESIINKQPGNEHWWPYDQQWWPRRTSICFPICGGLTDDEFLYEGETYRLPMHGFLREKEFSIIEQVATGLSWNTFLMKKPKRFIPSILGFILTQEKDNALSVIYTVENTGQDDLYYSVGSHYTYKAIILPKNRGLSLPVWRRPKKAENLSWKMEPLRAKRRIYLTAEIPRDQWLI